MPGNPHIFGKVICLSLIYYLLGSSIALADWPNHRGNASLQGIAKDDLGNELFLEWTFEVGKFLKSSPVVSDKKIFLGGPTGTFHALDAKTGTELWQSSAGIGVDAPAHVHAGKVFIGTKDGWLICFDAHTGKQLWNYETMGEIVGSPNYVLHPSDKKPLILVGSYDNFVHCVNAENGALVWKFESLNYINGTPAIWDNQAVVFGGCDAQLYVLSLSDGQLIRQIELGAPVASSVGVNESTAYVGNMEKSVQAVDLRSGEIIWKYEHKNFPYFSSPAISENFVIIGSRDKGLHAIDKNSGKQLWRYSARGRIDGSPIIAGEKVVVGSMDGKLYLLELKSGTIITEYEIGGSISSACALSEGWIFVGCEDGNIYAFSTNN